MKLNKFDLVQIRSDVAAMSETDLGSVVFFPSDSDGISRYSHLDVLNLPQYRQGGYVNTYQPKQRLVDIWLV